MKTKDAGWLAIDSLNGKYLFGMKGIPANGKITPQQTAAIVCKPMVRFDSEYLFIHSAVAPSFLIRRVLVGCMACGHVNNDPMIAEPYAIDFEDLPKLTADTDFSKQPIIINVDTKGTDLHRYNFKLPTIQPGVHLTMEVENIGDKSLRFLAGLIGSIPR